MNNENPTQHLVVDSHHHLWDLDFLEYPWMPAGNNILRKNYLPQELVPILKSNGVNKTIVVQAHESVKETQWLLDLAEANDFISGVVGWVDLTNPNLDVVLDLLQQKEHFVGVRNLVHDEPDDEWLIKQEVLEGLKEIARRGLTYDLLLRPRHLKHVPYLAEQVPGLRMVVDHIAKPMIAEGMVEPWATDIAFVATVPEVYCKVSGMVTEADLENWDIEDIKPYISHVVEQFGYNRLMFGSDWPVCLLAASYKQVTDLVLSSIGLASPEDRASLMGGNALKFYDL